MPQLLPLSRAARLAGVSRGALQVKIRSGELQTFEGKVKISDLVRVYPLVEMDSSPILERVEDIKAKARPRRQEDEFGLPTAEVLVQRLETLAQVFIETKADLYRSTELMGVVARRLETLAEGSGGDLWPQVRELTAWLAAEMANRASGREGGNRLSGYPISKPHGPTRAGSPRRSERPPRRRCSPPRPRRRRPR